MPKQKTCKAAKKRMKLTATGKVKRYKAGRRHLLSGRSRKRKRNMRGGIIQESAFAKKLRKTMRAQKLRSRSEREAAAEAAAKLAPAATPAAAVAGGEVAAK